MYKLDLEKAEEPEIKLPTSSGSQRKQGNFRKTCFIDYTKAFDCVDHNKLPKNSSRDTRPPYLCPGKPVRRSRKKLESDMKQQTGSKLGKEYIKVVYCHHEYLISMQNTSREVLG